MNTVGNEYVLIIIEFKSTEIYDDNRLNWPQQFLIAVDI